MELFRKHETTDPDKARLAREHAELTASLEAIRANYGFVTDSEIIDALIFEENAVLSRLAALYKTARESGVTLEYHETSHGLHR